MALDPKAVETQAVAEANSLWGRVIGAIKAHPKTALAIALAAVVIAVVLF